MKKIIPCSNLLSLMLVFAYVFSTCLVLPAGVKLSELWVSPFLSLDKRRVVFCFFPKAVAPWQLANVGFLVQLWELLPAVGR